MWTGIEESMECTMSITRYPPLDTMLTCQVDSLSSRRSTKVWKRDVVALGRVEIARERRKKAIPLATLVAPRDAAGR